MTLFCALKLNVRGRYKKESKMTSKQLRSTTKGTICGYSISAIKCGKKKVT